MDWKQKLKNKIDDFSSSVGRPVAPSQSDDHLKKAPQLSSSNSLGSSSDLFSDDPVVDDQSIFPLENDDDVSFDLENDDELSELLTDSPLARERIRVMEEVSSLLTLRLTNFSNWIRWLVQCVVSLKYPSNIRLRETVTFHNFDFLFIND